MELISHASSDILLYAALISEERLSDTEGYFRAYTLDVRNTHDLIDRLPERDLQQNYT